MDLEPAMEGGFLREEEEEEAPEIAGGGREGCESNWPLRPAGVPEANFRAGHSRTAISDFVGTHCGGRCDLPQNSAACIHVATAEFSGAAATLSLDASMHDRQITVYSPLVGSACLAASVDDPSDMTVASPSAQSSTAANTSHEKEEDKLGSQLVSVACCRCSALLTVSLAHSASDPSAGCILSTDSSYHWTRATGGCEAADGDGRAWMIPECVVQRRKGLQVLAAR